MAEKIKINDYGDCFYDEDSVIDLLYKDPELDISKLIIDSPKYNSSIASLGINLAKIPTAPDRQMPIAEFDEVNCKNWHMPESYSEINVLQWLLDKCQNDAERLRVQEEYSLFEEKKFIKVLQFLIYFVDTLRQNSMVWGVGRGSSVSSFCLFLIGIHKVNPMLYNLDYREFLR